ncbi:Methionine aminopeptidase 1D, chloroplastic/mitochondrial, partial [Ananas comosus]
VTKECLDKAISICAPGVEVNRIGKTIQCFDNFVGHGVGQVFQANPVVLHYITEDGSLSSQFEHMILFIGNGAKILTKC